MAIVLSGILDLEQHIAERQTNPNAYHPSQCPTCGRGGLWKHGVYYRRSKGEATTPIQRFLCSHCNSTCSCLPEYMPPRRWYRWLTQQLVLQLLLVTNDLQTAWRRLSSFQGIVPSFSTVRRWWLRLRHRTACINSICVMRSPS